MAKKRYQNKFNPIYWLILGLANCLRIVTWLPLSTQMKLGRKLGHVLMKRSPKMLKVARKNIELCFPEMTEQQQQAFLVANFENVGIGLFESLYSAWGPKNKLRPMLHSIEGLEQALDVHQSGQSIVFLFPHMIPMYMIGHLLFLEANMPMGLMYNSPKNVALDDFIYNKFAAEADGIFNRQDIRKMIRHLKQGSKCIWYSPDVDIGRKQSEFAPFFGQPAATLTASIRIAKLTGAKFFPIGFHRVEDWKYHIKVYPALSDFPSDDAVKDLTQINAAVEDIVRQKPDQYLWPYKRFSTRPPGEEKIY